MIFVDNNDKKTLNHKELDGCRNKTAKPVLIIRHQPTVPPGLLGHFLEDHHIDYLTIDAASHSLRALDPGQFAAIAIMGGNMSVNDPLSWLDDERFFIERALALDIPVLGHCLGGQLIAQVLGSQVKANVTVEVGWWPVVRAHKDAEPLLDGLPDLLTMFHWHNEYFEIPADCRHILSSENCGNQGFIFGDRVIALQCHPEVTPNIIHKWLEVAYHSLPAGHPGIQAYEAICEFVDHNAKALQWQAYRLYRNWLQHI